METTSACRCWKAKFLKYTLQGSAAAAVEEYIAVQFHVTENRTANEKIYSYISGDILETTSVGPPPLEEHGRYKINRATLE